ncbi:MAG: DUF4873 domain-containing protein [Mycobacterium sp.]
MGVPRAEKAFTAAGITNFAILHGGDKLGASFDESTHTWTLRTESGQSYRGRVVVSDQTRGGDDLVPYLGVAVHGAPNYFTVTGAQPVAQARLRYIAELLKLMKNRGSTRIEVRRSTQRLFHDRSRAKPDNPNASYWRRMRNLAPSAYDLSSHIGVEDEVYDGRATLRIGDDEHLARVRLSGHLDPIDGQYHWQGMVFEVLLDEALKRSQPVTLRVGDRSAEARITERTPQGSYSVVGVGAPPFALDDSDAAIPSR